MKFEGTWQIDGSNETLKITEQFATDQYLFEFSGSSNADEKVSIFQSTDRYARLARSKAYGRADIFIYDKNTFAIDDQRFIRVVTDQ